MDDRRKFVRLDIDVLVQWRKITGEEARELDKESRTKNISAGGICLTVDERNMVAIGDLLAIEMKLPTGRLINLAGRVAWVSEFEIIGAEAEKNYDAGIEFVEIKEADREAIQQFVFRRFNPRTMNE
jgi:c-di-GMP-binding flagellar brake protein YcgR